MCQPEFTIHFLKGGTFPLRSLGTSKVTSDLDIKATVCFYNRFKLDVPLEEVFLRDYQMPESSTLQNILTDAGLWMFLMTRSVQHHTDLE